MRVVIQRVAEAAVGIDGEIVSSISGGLLIFVGIEAADGKEDATWLAGKIGRMRLFPDEEGRMNRSLGDIAGEALVVSQFTLHAQTKKGNRPSFIRAAGPDHAKPLYRRFCALMEEEIGRPVGTGRFGADMKVSLVNDGPVTITIDSKARE